MDKKVTVELDWDTIDKITTSSMRDLLEDFESNLERRKKGAIGSSVFYTDKNKDIAEIKRHIDAFKTVLEYYGEEEGVEKMNDNDIRAADKEKPVGEYKFTETSIKLTNKQLVRLGEIAFNFKDVPVFTIETSNSSGIGTTVVVKFKLFEENDTIMDITDYKEW